MVFHTLVSCFHSDLTRLCALLLTLTETDYIIRGCFGIVVCMQKNKTVLRWNCFASLLIFRAKLEDNMNNNYMQIVGLFLCSESRKILCLC